MSNWKPAASQEALRARAGLLRFIRTFFAENGVMEVETPVLSPAGNSDPGMAQFRTSDPTPLHLRTSPEYAMKRLLAAGNQDMYEMGRVFRQAESGPRHNPEFTLLEWYRLGWRWDRLASETTELIQVCGREFGKDWPADRMSYQDLFEAQTGLDPHIAPAEQLAACAREHDLDVSGEMSRDDWLDLLMSHVLQPSMPADTVLTVYDYPASQAALARIREGDPPVAERFEVFLGGLELANGYHELTDAAEQQRRFEAENRHRIEDGQVPVPRDEQLLAAMKAGLPACSGVALGVDRLLMACLGADHLDAVLAFPVDRA